ncbi:MAG TPA: hypothetical protein VMV92_32545 [Streptosporangiaceae bacterium]|nr:hypothetical protein [Streptosporangiaceae bacterium]
MSEYQYYEFLALDKPLTDKQRAELRKLSSRAEITATRFINEYNYSDFRGSPEKLMERYFDAFLYLANWGTRRLMFRFPRALLDAEVARQYCHTDAASVIETSDHVIISLYLDRDPDNYWVEADDRLGPMVQARSDLATGDLRLLYLAWLLGAQWASEDDEDTVDDIEPPVPAGLGDLSAPLRAIADFLEIDKDLIAVAAETSPPLEEPTNDGLAEWITALPAAEKDTLLTMVTDGEGAQVQALLLRRFRGSNTSTTRRSGSVRTATGLRAAAERRAAERQKAQEQRRREEQARKAAARAAAYAKRLNELAAEGEAPWKQVDEMIATKKTSEYDRAAALLRDLRALAKHQGEEAAFAKRVLDLRAQYPGTPGLQDRFNKAGLPPAI